MSCACILYRDARKQQVSIFYGRKACRSGLTKRRFNPRASILPMVEPWPTSTTVPSTSGQTRASLASWMIRTSRRLVCIASNLHPLFCRTTRQDTKGTTTAKQIPVRTAAAAVSECIYVGAQGFASNLHATKPPRVCRALGAGARLVRLHFGSRAHLLGSLLLSLLDTHTKH